MSVPRLAQTLLTAAAVSLSMLACAQQQQDQRPGPGPHQGPGYGMGPRGGMMGGGPLLTPDERAGFCDRMQAAKTVEERRAVMEAAHRLMSTRAQERGMSAPEAGSMNWPRGGYGPGMHGQCMRELEPATPSQSPSPSQGSQGQPGGTTQR